MTSNRASINLLEIPVFSLLFALFLGMTSLALAEDDATELERMAQVLTKLEADRDATEDVMLPETPVSIALDEETQQAYLHSLRQYYSYRATGLEHRKNVFQWQLFSAKVIFIAVLALVTLGMYFAAVQFNIDIRKRRRKPEDVSNTGETQIELSTAGIKLTSPVLGVAILALSLGFFYLYLVFVYPIEDIF